MENRRGRWYLLSLISFPILFLALRGYFGEEAQEESQVALADLGNAIHRLRYLLVALFAAVIAVLVFELR